MRNQTKTMQQYYYYIVLQVLKNGKLVLDDRFEAKKDMLDKNPGLRGMYSENDGNTEVYYFDGGEATFSEFGKESRIVKF